MTATPRPLLPALLALPLAGCLAYPGTARPATFEDLHREEGWILLDSVPCVLQVSEKGCGAACLAMVLGSWGVPAPVEALEAECGLPAGDGIRVSTLRDAAKRRGLEAFAISGTVADLEHELRRGRPVVVGLAKPFGEGFTSHFEVVVGLDPVLGRVAAMDPGIGLTCDSLLGFEGEWRATKGVTLVVFRQEADPSRSLAGGPPTGGGP